MRHNRYFFRLVCTALLTFFCTLTFSLLWRRFVSNFLEKRLLLGVGNTGLACIIYIFTFLIIGNFVHAFKIGVERKSKLIASVILTVLMTNSIEILFSMAILNNFRYFRSFIWRYALLSAGQCAVCALLAYFMVDLYRKLVPPIKVLIVSGNNNDVAFKVNQIFHKYHVEKVLHADEPDDVIRQEAAKYEAVFINDIPAKKENTIVKMCFDMNKRVYIIPKISDILLKGSENLNVMDTPLFLCRNIGMSYWERAIKRLFDIVLSGLAIVVLSPLMIITAAAIKLEDHGPVFFRQERVTRGGKRFMIIKFRSMIVDAEKDGKPHPAGVADDRITRVGRIIRAYRIDELPQLFNIFSGNMSIVGPRPERWEHVEKYKKEIPEFSFREKVKGGLTGYAQVYGKYNTTALDKLKLDLIYITEFSIILDLQIIIETIKILFMKESTEGFSEERVKEMQNAA